MCNVLRTHTCVCVKYNSLVNFSIDYVSKDFLFISDLVVSSFVSMSVEYTFLL